MFTMVKIIPTKNVTHKKNENYECVLIQFEEDDKHFFVNQANWLPKHKEIYDYLYAIMKAEPQKKKAELYEYFKDALTRGRFQIDKDQN